ncbi:MAG: hypothetical protein MUF81_04635 [Verrucomicrobia bacterium]|jgi:hypothetical protein|nr:hypothetical protein [Verrucomicrobiota bacterium]
MKTSLKEWRRVYARIKNVRGLDEHEKVLYARSLAATPDERWQMNVQRFKALGIWGKGLAGKRKLERLVLAGKV